MQQNPPFAWPAYDFPTAIDPIINRNDNTFPNIWTICVLPGQYILIYTVKKWLQSFKKLRRDWLLYIDLFVLNFNFLDLRSIVCEYYLKMACWLFAQTNYSSFDNLYLFLVLFFKICIPYT